MARHFDAIVIGSGLGGLTAAALYARTGRHVLVLERNDTCGGAATVYRHGPLAIEASLHEIDGLDSDDPKLPIFRSLGLDKDLAFVDVTGRVAHAIMDLCGEPDAMTHPEGMQIKVSRQELSRLVGCSREMAGRVLKVLEDQGLLRATGKTIVVFNARPKTKTRPVIVPATAKPMGARTARVEADDDEDDEDDDE